MMRFVIALYPRLDYSLRDLYKGQILGRDGNLYASTH